MAKKSEDDTAQKLRRILVIHRQLRRKNIGRVVSGEDLAQYCSEEGLPCDERTIRSDLKLMKERLGAPLPDRANRHHGYYYTEPYSLFEGLDDSYLGQLNEVVALVRQLAKQGEFAGLEDLLLRLEERNEVAEADKNQLIHFEQVELTGKERLIPLYGHINKGQYLSITYQAFTEPVETRHIFPVMLREYNNRWYLIAWEAGKELPQNLALDRIQGIRATAVDFPYKRFFDFAAYYHDVIGVTRNESAAKVTVRLKLTNSKRAKYLETKKMHHSQKTIDGVVFELDVIPNLELEAKILEYGPDMEVLEPEFLREQVKEKVRKMMGVYGL